MNLGKFDEDAWTKRLADGLVKLKKTQEPFLKQYWHAHGFPTRVTFNGKDETPFPRDDIWTVLEDARLSHRFGNVEYFAPLVSALNPIRGVLRDHPTVAQAIGRQIGGDEIHVARLDSTTLTGLSQIIVGQMAQNPEATRDGFIRTASSLNALLRPTATVGSTSQSEMLKVGMHIALFYGVRLNGEIELGEGYSLAPLSELLDFVDPKWLEEVAPEHVSRRRTESIFGILCRFRWQPRIRNKFAFPEARGEDVQPPPLFHRWTEEFSNILAVSLGTRVSRIMTLEGCISRVASDLLGQHHQPSSPYKGQSISHLYNPFRRSEVADSTEIGRARDLFLRRSKTAYAELAPAVYRLAEAHGRQGRFAAQDRILDLAIVFEHVFKPPGRGISQFLQNEMAELLGPDQDAKVRVKAAVKHLYDVRSAIIHGPSDGRKQQLIRELDLAWKNGAALARHALLKALE